MLRFAARHHDVLTRGDLRALGLTNREIEHRIRSGLLHRLFRGVYAVGRPTVTERGRWRAAVAACGPKTLLSHWSAAALWAMRRSSTSRVHVSTPLSSQNRRGLTVHRVHPLPAQDCAVRSGIPLTSPTRTLVDLAAVASPRALAELVEEAVRLELVDRQSLGVALERHRGRRGVAALREIAARMDASAARTRSRLEALYVLLCRERGVPTPLINETVAGMEVDAVFPEHGVVVELDSYGYHGSWSSRQRDHQRAARLSAAGHELLRFDWEQVTGDPDGVYAATVAALRRGIQRRHH
jgi:predicted transcriptional regulator of viral defense system/very-short-patch-repair endonuclease